MAPSRHQAPSQHKALSAARHAHRIIALPTAIRLTSIHKNITKQLRIQTTANKSR